LTDAEAAAMMKTQVSWTGRYVTGEQTPDGLKITSHLDAATSEALNGTDRVYLMRVEGQQADHEVAGCNRPDDWCHEHR